jgi:hypothetical protein
MHRAIIIAAILFVVVVVVVVVVVASQKHAQPPNPPAPSPVQPPAPAPSPVQPPAPAPSPVQPPAPPVVNPCANANGSIDTGVGVSCMYQFNQQTWKTSPNITTYIAKSPDQAVTVCHDTAGCDGVYSVSDNTVFFSDEWFLFAMPSGADITTLTTTALNSSNTNLTLFMLPK